MTLQGRTALVTGGSRGVGRGIALRLAAGGAAVAVNYRRDADAAKQTVADIEAAGGTAVAYSASIDDPESVAAMVDAVHADLGPVDLVVSNAGTASRGSTIAHTDQDEYLRLFRVHALGPLDLVHRLLPDLRAAGRADVVIVSSVLSTQFPVNSAPYTMAKVAIEAAARTLAKEERAHGIRVNIVAPGLVATDMGERLVAATGGGSIAEVDARFPFGRVARPADVAGVVAFLASAEAEYLTGQRVEIDGGGPDAGLMT
ncbi:SDR family NAD(P)-dependent oxidoreductase [Pseudonocardia pini]|uniref:SDR family NAD(P)-dependent oxidoreductase n=1 Tax=Pseudonocardia pini TaxID=2758030 RepID=UPI0015F00608|nr:SDR family oxidoreductase [Pseudonocardia pini]